MLQKQKQIRAFIKMNNKKQVFILLFIVFLLIVILLCLFALFSEKDMKFNYGKGTCVNQITVFPKLNKILTDNTNAGYELKYQDVVSVGGVSLVSFKTCFVATRPPVVGLAKLSVSPFASWFAKRTYNINVSDFPSLKTGVFSKPIPTIKPLVISLSEVDMLFDYSIQIGEKSAECSTLGQSVYCDVGSLGLLHEKEYSVDIDRLFKGQYINTVIKSNIKTVSATKLVGSSVDEKQIVYDSPKKFDFTFNKILVDVQVSLEKVDDDGASKLIKSNIDIDKKIATINVSEDLERNTNYRFIISKVSSEDGSSLNGIETINFFMSNGPKVTTVSVGTYDLPLKGRIIMIFDQDIGDNQNLADYIKVNGVFGNLSKSGNQLYIDYENAPLCAAIDVNISPGLKSNYGISQSKPWSFKTRTTCHTESIIGYSVEGRPIIAYSFGSGSKVILYTGSIHGNEFSTKYLMEDWINELELNFYSIPPDRKIVVVPAINPDGIVAGRRNNSNNVDLNRNFMTADWQTDVFSPDNQPVLGGGGASPMSEPESQAIANLTIQLMPRLTMSFHSSASYVIGNQSGDSAVLAATYSNLVGYSNMTGVSGAFSYPITGTYDDWMREKYGLTSVLVELSNSYYSEFYRNREALWVMLRS